MHNKHLTQMQLDRMQEHMKTKTDQLRAANEQIEATNRRTNEFTNQIGIYIYSLFNLSQNTNDRLLLIANQESIIAKLKSISISKDRQLSNLQTRLDQLTSKNVDKSTINASVDVVRRKKKRATIVDDNSGSISVPEKPLDYHHDVRVDELYVYHHL